MANLLQRVPTALAIASGVVTIDFNSGGGDDFKYREFSVDLTEDITSMTILNASEGDTMLINFTNNSGAAKTISLPLFSYGIGGFTDLVPSVGDTEQYELTGYYRSGFWRFSFTQVVLLT